jgi:hypothetical protein
MHLAHLHKKASKNAVRDNQVSTRCHPHPLTGTYLPDSA